MKDTALLYPVFVQAALTFVLMFWMARERFKAFREKTVQFGPPGTRPVWTGRAGIVSNAFHNQLEMPILFFLVIAFTTIANGGDWLTTALAWAFAVLRILHAAIHTTYNHIPHRFMIYVASNAVLLVLWIRLALHVMSGGAASL